MADNPYDNHPDITMRPMYHLAWSFVHGGFDPANQGGCSCEKCCTLRTRIAEIRELEAREFDLRYQRDQQDRANTCVDREQSGEFTP